MGTNLGTMDLNVKEVMASVTLKVRLYGVRAFTFRVRLADCLIHLASLLLGCQYEILLDGKDNPNA